MNVKRFIWSCFLACIIIGCGSEKKQDPQDILEEWFKVHEGMTDVEIFTILGKPNETLYRNGKIVFFYSAGPRDSKLNSKLLQPSQLIVFVTNNVVNETHVFYH